LFLQAIKRSTPDKIRVALEYAGPDPVIERYSQAYSAAG
jgi:hypothetical protein